VSQRQFCIIFFSKRRTVFVPSIKPSSSASFLRDSVCHRSEARVTLRKPKNSRTRKGKTATDAVDVAREEIALTLFEGWPRRDFDELVRLMRMLADRLNEAPGGQLE
jgi:hypothetical protein